MKRLRMPNPMTLLLVGILAALLGLLLVVWLPVLQLNRNIDALRNRGGAVNVEPGQHAWLTGLADLPDTELFPRVVSVDLSQIDATDADLELVADMADVRRLAMFGTVVTDRGIEHLEELPALESILLLNCPSVSKAALSQLQTVRPQLEIIRRGNAFLGVALATRRFIATGGTGLADAPGCLVHVVPNGAARAAGLRTGDVIVTFDGKPVVDFDSLVELIGHHEPDDVVVIEAVRTDDKLQFEAVLGRWR